MLKTPKELSRVINIFKSNDLDYLLFKCEHIFNGVNSNLDILFLKTEDYRKAAFLLKKEGYKRHLNEKIEKYKEMYVIVKDSNLFAVHLHREVAWHGLIALDKRNLFLHKRAMKEIVLPSEEDYLLIHSAHIIFENFKINPNRDFIRLDLPLDWEYIKHTVKKRGWKKEFNYLMNCIIRSKKPNPFIFKKALLKRAVKNISNWSFFLLKSSRIILRKINCRRKGCLIALIGVNGSGKTTLTRKTLEKYKEVSKFFNGQFGYYFGWDPFLPTTKLISSRLKESNRSVFKELNNSSKWYHSLIFLYSYIEYFSRFYFKILPKLRRNKLIITDRYFYDLYGQYKANRLSRLLVRLFPQPDYLFVLDADFNDLVNRDKDTEVFSADIKRDKQRIVHEIAYIKEQKERYAFLAKMLNGRIMNTSKPINENIDFIINNTWGKLI